MAAGHVSQQQLRLEARLRPELMDPSFEGYKLSLDPLATFQVSKIKIEIFQIRLQTFLLLPFFCKSVD